MVRLFLALLLYAVTYPLQLTDAGANRMAWSPTGGQIAYIRDCDGADELHVVDEFGRNDRRLILGDELGAPAWSPDGTQIAVAGSIGGEDGIFAVGADGSGLTNLTAPTGGGSSPAWSPDGSHIAFARDGDVWVMEADGDNPLQLTDADVEEGEPHWSPDGDLISYRRASRLYQLAPGGAVWLVKPDGSDERQLTAYAIGHRAGYDWAPDGERIVISGNCGAGEQSAQAYVLHENEICLAGTSDGSLTTLVDDGLNNVHPAWSPDGSRIAYVATSYVEGGSTWIVVVDPDSGESYQIAAGRDEPVWSPDGTKVAVSGGGIWVYDADQRLP